MFQVVKQEGMKIASLNSKQSQDTLRTVLIPWQGRGLRWVQRWAHAGTRQQRKASDQASAALTQIKEDPIIGVTTGMSCGHRDVTGSGKGCML